MGITTRVQTLDRDASVFINDTLSPEAKSRAIAAIARQWIDEARDANRRVLGREVPYQIYVDGRPDGAALERVKPDGVIVAEFELVFETLRWIAEMLEMHSPVRTGRYKKSHALFADGIQVPADSDVPDAEEYVFINTQPYARKIERGLSSQAPDGVYQVVAVMARQRFSNVAQISFAFRGGFGGAFAAGWFSGRKPGGRDLRQPAIIVKLRA